MKPNPDATLGNTSAVLGDHGPPCLSLYQPTHRHHPDNQQDRIRFRNLVKSLEVSFAQKYAAREGVALFERFHRLEEIDDFWNYTLDGLAVFAAPNFFRVFRLPRRLSELAIVAETFHIKPLLRLLQATDRFQVLSLSRKAVKLFEGNRYFLDEVELAPEVPRTLTEALGDQLTESHQAAFAYGTGPGGPVVRQGQGGRKEEIEIDEERFFRVVDRAILEHHSRPSGLPLILAALPEHHAPFRRLSHNPFLLQDGVKANPDSLSNDELRQHAWEVLEPQYRAQLDELLESYAVAASKGQGESRLEKIAEALLAGRVDTLLVEADRQIPGRIHADTGQIELNDSTGAGVDDLLDDLAELALKKRSRVTIIPAERMPSSTGAAAIYRY